MTSRLEIWTGGGARDGKGEGGRVGGCLERITFRVSTEEGAKPAEERDWMAFRLQQPYERDEH